MVPSGSRNDSGACVINRGLVHSHVIERCFGHCGPVWVLPQIEISFALFSRMNGAIAGQIHPKIYRIAEMFGQNIILFSGADLDHL